MLLQVQCLSLYILIATLYQQLTQEATNNEASLCTPEQGRTDGMDNADDVARDDSNDDVEFPNDEDNFVIMILAVTMSQKIAAESAASNVFLCSQCLTCLVIDCATYPRIASFIPHLTAKAAARTYPSQRHLHS
jgi:hypothetical protein